MDIIETLQTTLGRENVLTGSDMAPFCHDWTHTYHWQPRAVVRPHTAHDVSSALSILYQADIAIVPVGGNTGLTGATSADGAVMISLDRMNHIQHICPNSGICVVQAGAILSAVHEAAAAHDMIFPMTFGAKGSAQIGGLLSTNAGGSNVLRYGNTRDLCLGIEVVLPDGRILDLMSQLHKDNSGLNLRNLFIGAEGTLGVITRAVMKLAPRPKAYATAMVAARSLPDALILLRELQAQTAGAVDAFEYMPRSYIEAHCAQIPDASEPFCAPHDVNLLVEISSCAARDVTLDDTGAVPLVSYLETLLAQFLDAGMILDAVVARSEMQRQTMWHRREAAAEVLFSHKPYIDSDIAVPIDKVPDVLAGIAQRVKKIDQGASILVVSHLGDGNVHHIVQPTRDDADLKDAIKEIIEDVTVSLGGSFSAEHGIGISKLPSMRRRKDATVLDAMRAIKTSFDPKGLMNPGKVLPD